MLTELIRQLRESGKLKWVVLGGLLLVGLILFALASSDKSSGKHKLVETSLLTNQNFGHLDGTDLYAYNGAAFYKIALDSNNALSVLHSGTKLPTPSAVYWANERGALLNFSGSFTLTGIELQLVAMDRGVGESNQDDTWYIDFSSGSIVRVSTSGVANGLAAYSENDKGFYYIPDTGDGKRPLNFYNIDTNKDQQVVEDLQVVDISYLGFCSGQKVCLIARDNNDPKNQRLYGIGSNNQRSQLLDSGGRLFATNDPEQYITVEPTDNPDDHSPVDSRYTAEEEDFAYPEEPAKLRTLGSDTAKELGFTVGSTKIVTHIDSGAYSVLDASLVEDAETEDETHFYRAGKTDSSKPKQNSLTYANGNDFTDGLIARYSHGSGNEVLISAISGEQLLFTTRQGIQSILPKDNQPKAEEKVNACIRDTAREFQYYDDERQFKIFFNSDSNFQSNVEKFSKCLFEGDASQVAGYNFYFGAVSPFNGRIITD